MVKDMNIKTKNIFIILIIVCIVIVFFKVQNENSYHSREVTKNTFKVYAITPTYSRPVQKAELTRISQTLLLVPFIHWIIVEDADGNSDLVRNLLNHTGLNKRSTLLHAKTTDSFKLKAKDPNWSKPRGVEQRNKALAWIRGQLTLHPYTPSVVYFMDDDNTYEIELFNEMKLIKEHKVGVWPVGLVGGLMVEKPLLDASNTVIGFNSAWRPERPFPIDMAGFAISTKLLLENPDAVFSYAVQRGYQESEILRHLTTLKELQPLADHCRKVYVWHTRTEQPKLEAENKLKAKGNASNNGIEV